MMKRLPVLTMLSLVAAAPGAFATPLERSIVVTSSNTADNRLLVYDTQGNLLEAVPTLGQGGVSGNAGGVAAHEGTVAVVNFASQTVSIFSRREPGFELRERVTTYSQPVSVAFGNDHLYILGTTTVESHRVVGGAADGVADGATPLVAADASAAHVGVVGGQLIVTEKSGTIELVPLRGGAIAGQAVAATIPAEGRNTPFGLVTRGSRAYVTVAGSDLVALVRAGRLSAAAATGIPNGAGQHSPCWIAISGPYLFTTNSPSHSISRLIAGGNRIVLDRAVAAQTVGAPIDVAAEPAHLAVIESNDGGAAHLTQYRIDEDGNLEQLSTTPIPTPANGVAILTQK